MGRACENRSQTGASRFRNFVNHHRYPGGLTPRLQPSRNEVRSPMRGVLVRYSLTIAGLCIFAAFVALYAYAPDLYTGILVRLGLAPFRYPFLDGQYVL